MKRSLAASIPVAAEADETIPASVDGRPASRPSRGRSLGPSPRIGAGAPDELAPGHAPGVDLRTLNRLKRGLIPPQTQIDLHRMTQDQAHRALIAFLADAQAAGQRLVLVITGKGFGTAGAVGVLKTNVPRWLNQLPVRERILAFTYATAAHGGEGALYVLLRRQRRQ